MATIGSPRSPSPLSRDASPVRRDQKDGSSTALSKPDTPPLRRPSPEPGTEREGKHVRTRHTRSPQAMSPETISQLLPAIDPKKPLPKALADITALAAAVGKENDPGKVRAVAVALLNDHAIGASKDDWLRPMLLKLLEALPTARSRNAARSALQEAVGAGTAALAGAQGAKHATRTLRLAQEVLASARPSLLDQVADAQQQGAGDDVLISLIEKNGDTDGEQRWQDLTGALVEVAIEQSDGATAARLQQVMRCALQVSPGLKTLRSDLLASAYGLLADTFGPALRSGDAGVRARAAEALQRGIVGCLEGVTKSASGPASDRWASEGASLKRDEFENIFSRIPAELRTALADRMYPPS